jgi:hypothetical protein
MLGERKNKIKIAQQQTTRKERRHDVISLLVYLQEKLETIGF